MPHNRGDYMHRSVFLLLMCLECSAVFRNKKELTAVLVSFHISHGEKQTSYETSVNTATADMFQQETRWGFIGLIN